jgi:hypothetical protein
MKIPAQSQMASVEETRMKESLKVRVRSQCLSVWTVSILSDQIRLRPMVYERCLS